MVNYEIVFGKQAEKDKRLISSAGFTDKVKTLLKIIMGNPYQTPPPYEKLVGNLNGYYSRRINLQHRLVYQIYENEKKIKILRMWTHYE